MNWLFPWDPQVCTRLCLTLLHSVWQAGLVALVVWGVDALWRSLSIERRYVLHVAALLAAVAAMPLTYVFLAQIQTPREAMPSTAASTEPAAAALATRATATPASPAAIPHNQTIAQTIVKPPSANDQPASGTAADDAAKDGPDGAGSINGWRTIAPWLSALYLLGVAGMFARLLAATVGTQRLIARAQPIAEGPLVDALRSLARQWSMNSVPALARAQRTITPKVVGLVRPTILLPMSAIAGLSPLEMQMILAHELAHVRRYDLWINLLQRLAEAVLFFNPAIWLLSRRISLLREYCCDELSCQSPTAHAAEHRLRYAMALVRVVELANPSSASLGELAALAASGRRQSEIRRRVSRLFGEPIREPLQVTRGGIVTMVILGALLIVGPTAWNTRAAAQADEAENRPATEASSQQPPREFQLTVLDPAGQPVANAGVEIRCDRLPSAEQITRGTFVKQARYGVLTRTDEAGRLTVALPTDPQRFAVSIRKPGFGPYWAGWQSFAHPQRRPRAFTARLDDAWSVGGIVVDEAGSPIAGVAVSPSITFKKRPGDTDRLGVGTAIKTAADGSWRYDHVPASKSDVHISLDHADYAPLRFNVPRDGYGIGLGEKPSRRIEMKRGITVTGMVKDDLGKPIAGALVRTEFLNEIRKATTNEQGLYRLVGCEPRLARIVVSAAGRAMDMKEVRIEQGIDPVDFTLQPGGRIRVRVVDAEGKGIAKARIFFQRWRGPIDYFEFDHVNQYANDEGVWEWNEAPLDEFEADICRPDGMQLERQKLLAGGNDYVFRPPPALVVSGRVVDAQTKQPIDKFRVVPGLRNADPRIRMNWIPRDAYEATDGKYRVRFTHSQLAHLVRIEADGYEVAISRDIQSDEGTIEVDFELRRAKDIAAAVVAADGAPAAGAKIALGVAGSQISIRNGDIHDGSTYATQFSTGKDGRFSIPARTEPFQLVITHAAGFAHLKSSDGPIPEHVVLTPWARIEGTFRVGPQPAPGVSLRIASEGIHSYGNGVPSIFTHEEITTGQDGRFVFERVVPGHGHIGREIVWMVDDGATEVASSVQTFVKFAAGKTTRVDLGGQGTPVVGKLTPPPEATGPIHWNFTRVDVAVDSTPPPMPTPPANVANDPNRYQAWWQAWIATDEGKQWKIAYEAHQQLERLQPRIYASVARDGSFRIDDVPPGDYILSVGGIDQRVPGVVHGIPFTVNAEPAQAAEPIDLGAIQLQKP